MATSTMKAPGSLLEDNAFQVPQYNPQPANDDFDLFNAAGT